MEVWFNKWKRISNELKSKNFTFLLRKGDCPPVFFNNIKLPHKSKAVYLRIHLERRLTWRSHIIANKAYNIRTQLVNWMPLKIKLR